MKLVTLTINGIQVDIQAAIIIDPTYGTQISFQHIYFARVNPGGDNYAAANNMTTPCSNTPCANGGFCVVVTKTSYNCLCTAGWGGKTFSITNVKKQLQEKLTFLRSKLFTSSRNTRLCGMRFGNNWYSYNHSSTK